MQDTYISFYLKNNRIHVFIESLRDIGSPKRICFMVGADGTSLILLPHGRRDFISHSVRSDVYKGVGGVEISSKKLCTIICGINQWDGVSSYRIPGKVFKDQKIIVFDLKKARKIEH